MVGCFDWDIVGLLLLMDDGLLLYCVIVLKFSVWKVYEVELGVDLCGDEVVLFVVGILLLEGEEMLLVVVGLVVFGL